MPIYEYRCTSCKKISSHLFRSFSAISAVSCSSCQGQSMERLISRVAIIKGEANRLNEFDTRDYLGTLDGQDPRSLSRWARRMSKELGGEVGAHLHESAEKVEAGEMVHGLYDPEHALRYSVESQKEKLAKEKGEQEPKSDEPLTIADMPM